MLLSPATLHVQLTIFLKMDQDYLIVLQMLKKEKDLSVKENFEQIIFEN